MVNLDANIVAMSLVAIGRSLKADFATIEWVISAYTLLLASLILPAGGMLIAGCGAGVLNGETARVSLIVIPPDRAGMASDIMGTYRYAGVVVGFAALGAVLYARVAELVPADAALRVAAGDLTAQSHLVAIAGFRDGLPGPAADRGGHCVRGCRPLLVTSSARQRPTATHRPQARPASRSLSGNEVAPVGALWTGDALLAAQSLGMPVRLLRQRRRPDAAAAVLAALRPAARRQRPLPPSSSGPGSSSASPFFVRRWPRRSGGSSQTDTGARSCLCAPASAWRSRCR